MNLHISAPATQTFPRIRNGYLGAVLAAAISLTFVAGYAISADGPAPASEASRVEVVRRVAPSANVAVTPHDFYLVATEAQHSILLRELNIGRFEAGLPEITDSQVVIAGSPEAEAAAQAIVTELDNVRLGGDATRLFDMRAR